MSALWTGLTGWQAGGSGDSGPAAAAKTRAKLRVVPAAAPRLARRPFAIVLIVMFGVGMTGLLMLNTTLQNQAFQSRSLNQQATQLAHIQVDLQTQLDSMAAAPELARRASDLGMRANPKPAFLVVPSGEVIGKEYRVKGNEMPGLIVKNETQLQAEDAAAAAKRARKKADELAATRNRALQADNKAIAAAEEKAQAAVAAKTDASKTDASKTDTGKTGTGKTDDTKSSDSTTSQSNSSQSNSGGDH